MKSDYAALRRVCSNITLYCDLRDPALFVVEGLVFRSTTLRTTLSRHARPHGLGRRVRLAQGWPKVAQGLARRCVTGLPPHHHRTYASDSAAGLLRTRRQWLMGGGNRCSAPNQYKGFRSLGLHPDCLIHPETSAPLDMDVYAAAPLPPQRTCNPCMQNRCRNACAKSMRAAPRERTLKRAVLLMPYRTTSTLMHARPTCDRIDISWMEHNVADRHNFFTKNFWMVSDIREIIVSGKRARLRVQRLVARGGNVFSFIAAPPQVS